PGGVERGTRRPRQYGQIRAGGGRRAGPRARAEESAARTVNREKARSGKASTSSRLSRKDISSGRRGGLRSGTSRPKGRTRDQLYEEARRMNIAGRSKMKKAQLRRAVDSRKKR